MLLKWVCLRKMSSMLMVFDLCISFLHYTGALLLPHIPRPSRGTERPFYQVD